MPRPRPPLLAVLLGILAAARHPVPGRPTTATPTSLLACQTGR
jgi:hypothetical protein